MEKDADESIAGRFRDARARIAAAGPCFLVACAAPRQEMCEPRVLQDTSFRRNARCSRYTARSNRGACSLPVALPLESCTCSVTHVLPGRRALLTHVPCGGAAVCAVCGVCGVRRCENLSWMENGFIQCFADVEGRRARIMDYAPGQLLQPHKHNIDEVCASLASRLSRVNTRDPPLRASRPTSFLILHSSLPSTLRCPAPHEQLFKITGGKVLVSKWLSGDPAERTSLILQAGDKLEIPDGTPHALSCDPEGGLQFHELVGTGEEAFVKRTTEFLVTRGFHMDLANQNSGAAATADAEAETAE